MVNPQRGEVGLTIDGRERPMRLSLAALAALEARLEMASLLDLVERFETGSFRAMDLTLLIWAGLNGGGFEITAEEVAEAEIEGGALEAAKAAARLLQATFGSANA